MISRLMTAEEFAGQKFDLPEGGRWHELIAGELVQLEPPDEEHGTVVLNLSKTLAARLHEHPQQGYACFELGIVVSRRPDTVLCPAISFFIGGDRFAEADKTVTETPPALVVEVASSPDRRRRMQERVEWHRQFGVRVVCVIETKERHVAVYGRDQSPAVFAEDDAVRANTIEEARAILPDFEISVEDLFAEPDWWHS